MDMKRRKDEILELIKLGLEEQAASTPAKPSQTIEGSQNIQTNDGITHQSIKGNGNVQISGAKGNVTVRTAKAKVEIAPPIGSIGANPALRTRIDSLIKKINEYRYQRLGSSLKFGAIYGDLAKAFGLKAADWKNIWLWDESTAGEIIAWLEGKLDNTQYGRIEKVTKQEGFQHSRGHLFRMERGYLEQLTWSDDHTKAQRILVIGKASRADMSNTELRAWISYLRQKVESMYGGEGSNHEA